MVQLETIVDGMLERTVIRTFAYLIFCFIPCCRGRSCYLSDLCVHFQGYLFTYFKDNRTEINRPHYIFAVVQT